MNRLLLITFAIAFSLRINAQVEGCTDPQANNYNPAATINNGSCTYNLTIYNPSLRYLLPQTIAETSGLALHQGKLFTINDSGDGPIVYGIDSLTGQVMQQITVNATNVDWESLAIDNEYLYIGDFGNNLGNRNDLIIYRVKLSEIPSSGNISVNADAIAFTYSDYAKDSVKDRNHNFDCEAFIATDQWLYLFSKNRGDYKTKLYRIPKQPGMYTAQLVTSFNVNGLITGADMSAATNEICLVGYTDQSWIPFTWLLWDYNEDDFFGGNKRRIDMPNMIATQTEAVAYTLNKNQIITSEGNPLVTQSAYNFNSGTWTNSSPSSVDNEQQRNFDFVISPNPAKKDKINVDITDLPYGDYQLEIYDSSGIKRNDYQYSMSKKSGKTRVKIRFNDYPSGIYFVRIISGNNTVEKKFVVM